MAALAATLKTTLTLKQKCSKRTIVVTEQPTMTCRYARMRSKVSKQKKGNHRGRAAIFTNGSQLLDFFKELIP